MRNVGLYHFVTICVDAEFSLGNYLCCKCRYPGMSTRTSVITKIGYKFMCYSEHISRFSFPHQEERSTSKQCEIRDSLRITLFLQSWVNVTSSSTLDFLKTNVD